MSTMNGNLDLLNVETEDHNQLASKITQFYTNDSNIKSQLSWGWERNQLMLDGKQWLTYTGNTGSGGGQWQRTSVSKQNEYIPRPVTNYLFSCYQTLKSYLIKEKPRSVVKPNTQEHKDKTAAKLATLVLETNWARLKEQYNYETAASILVTYGTVFKKSYWDTTTVNLVKIPRMQIVPVTDPLTGEIIGQNEVEERDPITGDPVFDELPLGDLNTCVVDPMRITVDPLALNEHEFKWIMESSIQTIDWVKQTYGKEGEGYTGLAHEIQEETQLNQSMRRWFNLRTSSGMKNLSSANVGSSTASDVMVENSVVVKEYYERPSSKYPKGRMIVVAGGKTLFASESPYSGPEMGDWHPYSECRWELVPGRFWGKSVFDEAVELQKRLNTVDSTIILTRKTMAIPQWKVPIGSGVEPGAITGRPGQMINYRDSGNGLSPEKVPGVAVDGSVFQERAQIIEDLKEITGAIDILQGDRPQGVNAASALSMLYEVGTGKLFPIMDRWKMFIENDQKKQLRIISKYYKEPRPEFIRMLKARNSELSELEINQFLGSDLYDNCNVTIEAGSNIPKLQSAKQAMLLQLAQLNALNLQNPGNMAKFQEDMGVTGYDQDVGPDRKRAQWENDIMDNIVNNPANKPIVLDVDNDQLHIEEHQTRMKSPAFMSLPIEVQQTYMLHIQEHEQSAARKAMAQMYQQQAMAPEPGSTHVQRPSGGQPMGAKKDGAGMGADLKKAVIGADLLSPATIEGR